MVRRPEKAKLPLEEEPFRRSPKLHHNVAQKKIRIRANMRPKKARTSVAFGKTSGEDAAEA